VLKTLTGQKITLYTLLFRGVNNCADGTNALNKFSGQLWYLSQGLVALGFFDQEVPDDMKR